MRYIVIHDEQYTKVLLVFRHFYGNSHQTLVLETYRLISMAAKGCVIFWTHSFLHSSHNSLCYHQMIRLILKMNHFVSEQIRIPLYNNNIMLQIAGVFLMHLNVMSFNCYFIKCASNTPKLTVWGVHTFNKSSDQPNGPVPMTVVLHPVYPCSWFPLSFFMAVYLSSDVSSNFSAADSWVVF